ncbi:hypothetical protein ERO13_A13G148100v2 [Gossypium hirsutum]|uniref:Transcription termination factor MTERF5, chloroplastic n=1 Tax=Gossypium hirsutum TaxID=3635 RepID=A0A1U8ICS8_GOSHI|nr:transcription termination factor MTERF5, chloroplastic [Gossypium hirsutum]KAG4166684.1 hypothetical protein ERO13_A13G148100v2 [Gossypium hirsutum]
MQTLKSSSIFSSFRLLKPNSFIVIQYFSASSSVTVAPNPPLFNYLVKDLNFDEIQAFSISNRFRKVKSLEKTQSAVNFLQSLGFSNAQIASSARLAPQILFADVENVLRPKIKFFQDLGLMEPHIPKFFSMNSTLLTCSLDKKLIPSVQLVKKVLGNNNEDLFKVFSRCNGFIARDSILKLSRNIEYLESCGIVGSQLSMLLRRQPRIFRMRESTLRNLVSRALDMGFSTDSRMLVHAIHTMNCLSEKTFKKKWELLKSCGFSENDCATMFRKAPGLFRVSEEKLKLGIEFFINAAKFNKDIVASNPFLLMYSLEDRVIPRYRVMQIIKSKMLLKKDRSFLYILDQTEIEFLKFISRFTDDVEELLIAYKAHLFPTSSSEEEAT